VRAEVARWEARLNAASAPQLRSADSQRRFAASQIRSFAGDSILPPLLLALRGDGLLLGDGVGDGNSLLEALGRRRGVDNLTEDFLYFLGNLVALCRKQPEKVR
jgi:hypothetical protein